MTPKANHNIKYLIISILQNYIFSHLNKARKNFIISVLWHILSIKGRINFLQLGRFSPYCVQTHRNQFELDFDFLTFNKLLIKEIIGNDRIIVFVPSYIQNQESKLMLEVNFGQVLQKRQNQDLKSVGLQ
jgi:hypothetical protein